MFHNLKKVIKGKFGGDATLIGDEGGFAPPCVRALRVHTCVLACTACRFLHQFFQTRAHSR